MSTLHGIVNRSQIVWGQEPPTQCGWYWFRVRESDLPYIVKVYTAGNIYYVWPLGDEHVKPISQRLEHCHGQWAGPIEPPASG
ncbi:MAG TPA: hypothetical protein VFS39_07740 [Nitrospira sp.]|nr:hypothetical protein [Nitrospira sp.]